VGKGETDPIRSPRVLGQKRFLAVERGKRGKKTGQHLNGQCGERQRRIVSGPRHFFGRIRTSPEITSNLLANERKKEERTARFPVPGLLLAGGAKRGMITHKYGLLQAGPPNRDKDHRRRNVFPEDRRVNKKKEMVKPRTWRELGR